MFVLIVSSNVCFVLFCLFLSLFVCPFVCLID